jgi:hypothetical protein
MTAVTPAKLLDPQPEPKQGLMLWQFYAIVTNTADLCRTPQPIRGTDGMTNKKTTRRE